MNRVLAALLATMAISCQAAATNANNNAQANANNNAQANVNNNAQANAGNNSSRAYKVDSNFMYMLLAIKELAMDANSKGLLSQLLTLDALWNSNNNTKNMFQSVNFCAANVGLYYDQAAMAFKMIDLSSGADISIAQLAARMQAIANITSAPTPSGLVDLGLGLNALDLVKLDTKVGVLSGLLDVGAGLNVLDLIDLKAEVGVLSGLVDLGLGLNVADLVDLNTEVGVLSGLVDLGAGLNVADIVDVNAGVGVLSGLVDTNLGLNVADIVDVNAGLGLLSGASDGGSLANLSLDLSALGLIDLSNSVKLG